MVTQVIMGGQEFDTRTGILSQLSPNEISTLEALTKELPGGGPIVPTSVNTDQTTIIYVSPN